MTHRNVAGIQLNYYSLAQHISIDYFDGGFPRARHLSMRQKCKFISTEGANHAWKVIGISKL